MTVKKLLAVSLGSMALIAATSSAASAGEINGTGNPPGGEGLGASHAASICAFSGLEDGSEGGPAGPGAPPQNFGQALKAGFFTIAQAKQFGALPGQACNPNTPPPPEGGTP